jgi:hypothetical protein
MTKCEVATFSNQSHEIVAAEVALYISQTAVRKNGVEPQISVAYGGVSPGTHGFFFTALVAITWVGQGDLVSYR